MVSIFNYYINLQEYTWLEYGFRFNPNFKKIICWKDPNIGLDL